MSEIFVLLTVDTETFVTFVFCRRRFPSTLLATPLTFAHRFLSRGGLLVVRETRGVSKISVAVVAGDSGLRERARGTGRAIATVWSQTSVTSIVTPYYNLYTHTSWPRQL